MANVVLYKEGLLTREEADSDDYLSYVTSFCLQDALLYERLESDAELLAVLTEEYELPCCGARRSVAAFLAADGCGNEACGAPDFYYSFCSREFAPGSERTHCYRCHVCVDWRYWHCTECDKCSYYAYDGTEPRCTHCGKPGTFIEGSELGEGSVRGSTSAVGSELTRGGDDDDDDDDADGGDGDFDDLDGDLDDGDDDTYIGDDDDGDDGEAYGENYGEDGEAYDDGDYEGAYDTGPSSSSQHRARGGQDDEGTALLANDVGVDGDDGEGEGDNDDDDDDDDAPLVEWHSFPPLYVPLLHFVAFSLVTITLGWQATFPLDTFGWYLQFMTIDVLLLQGLYFVLVMGVDLFPNAHRLRTVTDALFTVSSACTVATSALFWAVAAIDPQGTAALIPRGERMPWQLVALSHAAPAFYSAVDALVTVHTVRVGKHNVFRGSFVRDAVLLMTWGGAYTVWAWYCAERNGHWPYPFQADLDAAGHALFFATGVAAGSAALAAVRTAAARIGPRSLAITGKLR